MGDCDRALMTMVDPITGEETAFACNPRADSDHAGRSSIRALGSLTVHALSLKPNGKPYLQSLCGERFVPGSRSRIGQETIACRRCLRILDRPAK